MVNKATLSPAVGSMKLGGKTYAVTGCITTTDGKRIPVVNLPVMSDEKWRELSKRRPAHAG